MKIKNKVWKQRWKVKNQNKFKNDSRKQKDKLKIKSKSKSWKKGIEMKGKEGKGGKKILKNLSC